jgi:methyltransferase-like protein
VYFAEFARRAATHALHFVCEAKVWLSGWQSEGVVKETFGYDGPDPIRMEQCLDFIRGRTFRMTVLCHDSIPVHRVPDAVAIPDLLFVGTAIQEPQNAGTDESGFRSREGTVTTTNHPVMIAALRALTHASPQTLSYAELVSQVRDRLAMTDVPGLPGSGQQEEDIASALPDILLQCARGALLDVEAHAAPMVTRVSERPRASLVGRARAARTNSIPTLIHGRVSIGAPEQFLLARLDGSRTRAELAAELLAATESGEVVFANTSVTRETAATAVSDMLKFFATCALLEA